MLTLLSRLLENTDSPEKLLCAIIQFSYSFGAFFSLSFAAWVYTV